MNFNTPSTRIMFKNPFSSCTSLSSGEGHTSFLRAARAGHLDKIIEHLKNNVDINTSNANGLNALHLASKDGHLHVVTELLNRGANVDSATKKGNTALHIASLAGQYEVVKQLIENGASVNVQSQNGFTPLYMAAQENHDEVVRYLLDHGANQSLSTEDGFTPLAVAMQQGHDKVVAVLLENDTRGKVRLPALHIAAKKDDTKAAKLLLENEHNPDVTSKSGFTPLHIASHYGNEAVANILLDKQADVNFSAKHNITPLHVAAKWGKANMVTVLLARGANIDNKTRDGLTALHCAARSGHEAVIEQLLEHGAPISSKTKNGLAPLHMAAQGDHVDTARVLLFHKAPVDDVTVDYLTALHVAAHCGHARVAKTLVDKKADPNARALNGFTPLHIACKKNRIKVVELLLKHGASIEATTESGLTPLHVASFMGCMNIVIYLLQNEASPDIPTVRGETPLHLAARANQTDIIRILLRNGAQVDARAREQQTPLHIASRLGNVDIVMLLLQHGAVVDSTTKDLYTALHIAAKEGQEEVAAVLLENGASLTSTTKKNFTPLHLTGKYGHIKVAKLLLQKDAPVDFQGKNGVTPLHVASHYDHQNVALLLLEKGASVHATAKNGHTPLHIAAKKNQMDIATTLLEYGAQSNAESLAGFTPLHLSASEGHADMSAMLIEHEANVNHAAKNGLTPLHLCAQEDRVAVSEILLKNGAKVDTPTIKGFTPLHIACHYGQISMVRLLLDNGANVSCTTDQGFTPLHHSAQQGHSTIVALLLDKGASPNATNKEGHTALSIAQKLGYISVEESLKGVTETLIIAKADGEKHKVVAPEIMQETFMSDSEDENGEDTVLNDQPYRYLTVDEMKSLGDDSLPIDVTRDERTEAQVLSAPPTADHDSISPLHASYTLNLTNIAAPDNVDIGKAPMSFGFLVSFLVDARGGAMRGCRHSGVRLIVPPRRAAAPTRVTCRYLRKDKLSHPPPLMEGEALASRILELGPVGAKFLGPVMIEVPHFASLRGTEREIVILRSDNGEAWREHTVEASEEVVQEILSHSYEKDADMPPPVEADPSRLTRILTLDFPHYFAVVSRVKQEVHAIGPEGGMVSSSVVPQVQAVFPQGALTKKIKVGLQAQPIPTDITAKLLGNRVAVSPIVTIEPRRRKFHKPITLTIPVPQAANKGMINQYSGDAPTLRLLCSITGGTARAQWEDVTGTTPLTFVKDCVSFTTTVSARFWLMDCRNVQDSAKMATELYREAIHVPFLAKFVVFAKRIEQLEARLRVFCMTDDKEDKTLEHQEHFTEVAKSRDVEVLEGKCQFVEFAGNLVPVTKSGDQLRLGFRAFRENRLPFTVRVKDPHADVIGRTLFMREPKVSKGEAPQQPICVLNIVLPEEIIPETTVPDSELTRYQYLTHSSGLESYQRTELRLSDISNLLENDWIPLASNLGISNSDISKIESDHAGNEAQQAMAMLKLWMKQSSNRPSAATLESGLVYIGREDIIRQCIHSGDQSTDYPDSISSTFRTTEFVQDPRGHSTNIKDTDRDRKLFDHAEIKESNIIEEPSKPVAEHRREIEKRLSQERSSSLEKTEKKSEELKMRTKITENVTLTETVAKDEPQLSFHDKRLSFERGNSQDRAKTDIFIQEEKKSLVITSSPLDTVEVKVDEAAKLSFKEKRKSFEQGSIEKSDKDDKKPKSDTKKVDEKIIEFRDELMSVPKHDKITENKHVSETLSKTVETIGDKKSIVSEKLTKTTEIKSDEKPITTELSRTTDQVERVEKPVVSEKKTKIIEEKDIVIIPGAIDTVEKLVSKPDVNETIETSFKVDPTYDMKAKIKTSKDDSVVSETITVMTDSKPIDEITVSVGSPKEKSGVSETVTTLTTGDKITKEIINIEISNKNPVISETITTVIYDSKPTKELTKDKPVVGESTITVIPDAKPQTDINRTAVNEVITSVTTDKKPTEQAKAFEEIAEKIFKAESKETEPIVFSSTGDKFDSRAVVTDEVSTKTDSKPPDQIKEIKETTKPLTIETVTTVKAGENPLVSGTITSVTATSKPTEEITTLSKSLKPAPEKESRIEEVAIKDTTEKISKDKSTGDLQNILKDGIQTTDSCIISEMITTKKMEGAPSETKTVTEITKKFSEKGKPDQQTVITEINTGEPDMSLEERRKSELFEGVTQGLLANVKNQEPKSKDIISPKLINTPPPSPADFKDATSVSSPTTDPSWTSSTTLTDKTAIFIESERGPKPTDKPLQDSYKESKTSISVLNDQSEFENRDEPSSSQGYRKKKEESSEVDIKKSNDAPKK